MIQWREKKIHQESRLTARTLLPWKWRHLRGIAIAPLLLSTLILIIRRIIINPWMTPDQEYKSTLIEEFYHFLFFNRQTLNWLYLSSAERVFNAFIFMFFPATVRTMAGSFSSFYTSESQDSQNITSGDTGKKKKAARCINKLLVYSSYAWHAMWYLHQHRVNTSKEGFFLSDG